jgi:general nucleoside transport system permease protein
MRNRNRSFPSRGMVSAASSLISIAAGLLLGLILLVVFNSGSALYGFGNMMLTGIKNPEKLAKVLYTAAPLLMTGLSVGFAFKTGLFNIGATGQYTIGGFMALVAAIAFHWPWWAALFMAFIGGAVWGAIPGICKAYFNVNEVITSIMFNWIGLYLVNLLLYNMPVMLASFWGAHNKDRTAPLAIANPGGVIPKLGMDQLFGSNYINIGIFIAALITLIIWILLNKTTFGYELKACGYNRNASLYAGINARRNIVSSMTIAGALSGIGGGIYFLSGTAQFAMGKVLLATGFNGIPVAMLASSNPIATIFTSLFISYIQVGGDAMQPEFAKEIIDIIIAVIIYFSAFSLLIRSAVERLLARGAREDKSGDGQVPEEECAVQAREAVL